MQPRLNSNCFWTNLFDGKGNITKQFKQCIGEGGNSHRTAGSAIFSPNGKKYVMTTTAENYEVNIYDFDRCSGLFSNPIHLKMPKEDPWRFKYCAFSPNSRFLYVSAREKIYQYDLEAENIDSSRVTVAIYDGFVDWAQTIFLMMQNGPDGKIYVATGSSTKYYHYINQPDSLGLKCDVRQHSIKLATPNFWSIPQFPHYRMPPSEKPCPVSVNENNNDFSWRLRLFPNPSNININLEDLNSDDTKWESRIYNLAGQIQIEKIWQNDNLIDISNLPSGLYLLKSIHESGKSATQRFIIQH